MGGGGEIRSHAKNGDVTFHTHIAGMVSSTSTHNARAGSDTETAINTGADVYVVSPDGLSLAPANAKDATGQYSQWIQKGPNWLDALKKQCK